MEERNPWTVAALPPMACRRCGHRWTPRIPDPRLCPNCSQDWRTPQKWKRGGAPRWHCRRCGARWPGRIAQAPARCAQCHAVNWWRPAGRKGAKAPWVPPPKPSGPVFTGSAGRPTPARRPGRSA